MRGVRGPLTERDGVLVCPECGRLYGPALSPSFSRSHSILIQRTKASKYVVPLARELKAPRSVVEGRSG